MIDKLEEDGNVKGAVVFLLAFVVFLVISLVYSELPPGRQIYGLLGVQEVTEPVLGIPATDLVVSVFNGVIYGVVVWFVYSLVENATKSKKEQKREDDTSA